MYLTQSEMMLVTAYRKGLNKKLGDKRWATLCTMLQYVQKDNCCIVPQGKIAADLNVTRQTANERIKDLACFKVGNGPILKVIQSRSMDKKKWDINKYIFSNSVFTDTVNIPDIEENIEAPAKTAESSFSDNSIKYTIRTDKLVNKVVVVEAATFQKNKAVDVIVDFFQKNYDRQPVPDLIHECRKINDNNLSILTNSLEVLSAFSKRKHVERPDGFLISALRDPSGLGWRLPPTIKELSNTVNHTVGPHYYPCKRKKNIDHKVDQKKRELIKTIYVC